MKILYTILLITFFVSCNNNPISSIEEKKSQKHTTLETFLLDYLKNNPTALNNATTIKKTSVILKKKITELLTENDSIFYHNPIEFFKSWGDEKTYGNFMIFNQKISEDNIADYEQKVLSVFLIMDIPKDQIDSMKEDQKYRVVGNIKRYIDEKNDKNFQISSPLLPFEPSMEYDRLIKNKVVFNLGCIYFEPKKFEILNEKN